MNRLIPALRLTGVGFFIGTCIVGGILAGLWLDNRLDSRPWFTIIGIIAGLAVAIFGIYRMIRPLMNGKQDKENG